MQLDPLVPLAVTIQSSPSTYALVLGSGISRSSGVQTGWEVMGVLISRLAKAHDGSEPADPYAWYEDQFGDTPDYSRLIQSLGATPADRRGLLSEFFEPSEDEADRGIKQPSPAHRVIARLVAKGYIAVIVTTNFDRLLEQALVDEGIQPIVITNASSLHGAMPLQHARCTVLKVNGDYLEPEIKNTMAELDNYEPAIDQLLDRVFDEYGIIVCGWSGDWDTALRVALNRNISRRYGTYFAHKEPLKAMASRVLNDRQGTAIEIDNADSFFESLESKILGLESYRAPRMSMEIAKAEVKMLLVDPRHRIRLHELIFKQIRRVLDLDFSVDNGVSPTSQMLVDRMHTYEEETSILNNVLFQLAYFSDGPEHEQLLRDGLTALSGFKSSGAGYTDWLMLESYPLLLATYATGLGLVARKRFAPLMIDLPDLNVAQYNDTRRFFGAIDPGNVLSSVACNFALKSLTGQHTPESDYLFSVIRRWCEETILPSAKIEEVFETFEYLLSIVAAQTSGRRYLGRSTWHRTSSFHEAILNEYTPSILTGSLAHIPVGDLIAVHTVWTRSIPSHWH